MRWEATSVLVVQPKATRVTLVVPGPPMIFRPSRKLATKIKVGRLEPLPLAEDPLADWSSPIGLTTSY